MRMGYLFSLVKSMHLSHLFLSNGTRRKLICLTLILSLLILPAPSRAFSELSSLASSTLSIGAISINHLPSLWKWLLRSTGDEREETLEDRLAHVSHIQISPTRFVGYEGQAVNFTAIGLDSADRTIQGLVFSWESSDPSKVEIDGNGRATFHQPGNCEIIGRAGAVTTAARVLVKAGQRPLQTDEEWRNDQRSLSESTSTTVGAILPNLLNKLMPTAHAQGGGYTAADFGFDEMWAEPRNLIGNPLNRVLEPTVMGSVLPEGNNANYSVPLITTGGRGIGASLNLFYNSRVWSRHSNAFTFSPAGGFPFAGFSLGYGRILTYGTSSSTKYVLLDADGTQHYLGSGNASTTGTYQTTDGTHITYVGNGTTGGTVYYNDGTTIDIQVANNRLLPVQITDSNGNFIEIAYKNSTTSGTSPLAIDNVTDTKGRVIQFNYDATSKLLISITAPGYGGTSSSPVTRTVAQFDYESRTLSSSFVGFNPTIENMPSGSVSVLKHVYFPGTNNGYLFTYSDYGMIYNVSLRRQMSINGSGMISDGNENASVEFNYPTSASSLSDAPAFTQRTESGPTLTTGVYTYSNSTNSTAQTKTFTIARPDSSNLILTRSTDSSSVANGLSIETEITKSSVSYSKIVTSYTTDSGSNVQPQTITSYDDTGVSTRVAIEYDAYGNITNKYEYGYQISGNWQVRRRTRTTYKTDTAYLNAYLRRLPTLIEVLKTFDNSNNSDDVVIAKTENIYDDYAATGGMTDRTPKPPGHDSAKYTTSYTVRGNITGTTSWIDIAGNTTLPTQLRKYDRMGNLLQEQLSCCKQKAFSYVSTDYWSNPPDVTKGDPAGVHLTGSTTYDFNTDLPKYTEYANLGKTWFYYDAALRLVQEDLPAGATETITYNDAARTTTFSKTGLGSSTVTYDGWDRIIEQIDPNNGQVNIGYDAFGRKISQTNPFTAGGTPGSSANTQYDALGRVTLVTLTDSQILTTTYSGNSVTMTDQVNRKSKRENDGLGRLVKVTEQDTSTGNLTWETTYSYNLLDKLTEVNQGNQSRLFKHDALGRLLYERIPEQTATIDDGTGTYWTSKYTYTDFNAVETVKDARGVVATRSYDGLNRLTGISYNTSGTGVASTSSESYTYDTTTSSPTNGLLLSAGNESYGYDTYKRLNSVTRTIDSTTYTSSYQYNAASQRSQITYPSSRVVNINRGSTGRLTSLTDGASTNYLSSIGYNTAGYVTGLTLGNGVVENFGYSADRLQLTSQTATKSGTTLMSLAYDYDASSGENGSGSTAGNSGQLMGVTENIGGVSGSAAYTYNNVSNLVTSNQSTNGVSEQRQYYQDRWGNRTKVYDATSGGNLIQQIDLEESSSIPTNRLKTVHSQATNVAAASNGATATASSTYNSTTTPASGVINGDHKGSNWGSGGGWMDNTAGTYPDWLQIDFSGSKTISEIDVYTIQDNYSSPSEPTETMTFSNYGLTNYAVQYWDGSAWQTISGGSVTGNNKVWRKFTFSNVTTNKIRVSITGTADGISRLAEVEAYGSYTYDANGNVTSDTSHTYQYDARNRMVSVDGGTTATYVYDQNNRRVKKTVSSSVTHYVWEGNQVIAEYDGTTSGLLSESVYAGWRLIAKFAGGVTRYYLSDKLSQRVTLDASGAIVGKQAHLPYGEELGSSGEQDKHRLNTYERDTETGNDYATNRGYTAAIGRFNQADPYRASSYLVNPQSWNRYAYVENDPVNYLDTIGLFRSTGVPSNFEAPPGTTVADRLGQKGRKRNVPNQPSPEESTGPTLHKYAALVRDFFSHNPECTRGFFAPIFKQFIAAAQKAQWHDLTTPAYSGELEGNLYEFGIAESATDWKLKDMLGTNGADARVLGGLGVNALVSRSRNTVYLGYQFQKAGEAGLSYLQELIATHEAMHMVFDEGDEKLAQRLGLSYDASGNDFERASKASGAINQFLLNKCQR
jgi:RHS repeat-associated protein